MQSIPLKCSVFQYLKENFLEYSLPDGYFEITENGYYEKVSKAFDLHWINIDFVARRLLQPTNWSAACLKFLQSLLVNVNIRIINSRGIIKYAANSEDRKQLTTNKQRLSIPPTTDVENDINLTKPKCEISDDERHMTEALIG